MANKAQPCPKCGSRLFLYTSEGKECAKCGQLISEDNKPSISDVKSPTSNVEIAAPTATCPTCGSEGRFSSSDADGKPWYNCPVCGASYTPTPKNPRPTYVAPATQTITPVVPQGPKELDGKEIFDLARKSTVEFRKWLTKEKNMISGSSAFYITSDLMLTCSHCVVEGSIENGTPVIDTCKLEARYKGENYAPVKLLYYDTKHDLALVKATKHSYKPTKIAKENAKTGEAIYSVGNTLNKGMCIMQGIVSDELRIVGGKVKREMMMNSANTLNGNSGCPTFNVYGEVVGVHTSGDYASTAMKYDAPVTRIRSFLKDAEKKLGIKIKID